MTTAPTPITDETRKYVEERVSEARKTDGCEGILLLADPTTGEGLAINLFRDQAAVDAFQALSQRLTKEAEQDLGAKVGEPHVYEVLARLLRGDAGSGSTPGGSDCTSRPYSPTILFVA